MLSAVQATMHGKGPRLCPASQVTYQHRCAGTFKGEQVAVKVLHAAHLGKGSPTHKAFEQEVAVLSR